MPNTRKAVPLSKELVQRERETTEMSLLNEKGKPRPSTSKPSPDGKNAADKEARGRKVHQ